MVIENDSLLKQIMKWNSSENLLTLVEEEKEEYESTEILFFLKLVRQPFLFFLSHHYLIHQNLPLNMYFL